MHSGFSNTACRILDALNTPYETVNVLDDERIRQGIKTYSSWPTIPQLYVAGEFVGGSDIMVDMYQNGQLAEMIEIANAS
jgi:monothiol glutaredoxin